MASERSEIPSDFEDLLDAKGFAHVATIGPNGEPHTSPVWYTWDGTHMLFSHTKTRQRYQNLKRDPRIAVSIADPDNPYRNIELRGVAEIEDDPDGSLIDRLAKKYMGADRYEYDPPGTERIIVKLRPTHVNTLKFG